jgi:hypothetical protein
MSYEQLAQEITELAASTAELTQMASDVLTVATAKLKVNAAYPFTFVQGQTQYDVGVISGDPSVTTAGMVLWVEGAIEYAFTVDTMHKFTLVTPEIYADGQQMRVITNARYDHLFEQLDTLFDAEKEKRTQDYLSYLESLGLEAEVPYSAGIELVRSTQVVRYLDVNYRPVRAALPFTTGTWATDQGKLIQAEDITLRQTLTSPNGAEEVGFPLEGGTPATVYSVLAGVRRPIELFGAVGDYDPVTQTGTDCTGAFLLAKAAGVPILLGKNKKYLITETIRAWSSMDILGDDSYSPEIHCKFSSSGKLFIASPFTGGRLSNIVLKGFTIARIGTHAEHGILIDNVDGLFIDLKIISDGTALGGALGVSAFYPYNRPSTNCFSKLVCEKGGNFALQYGNVDNGSMQVFSRDTMREVLGIEPYTLGKWDFTTSAADALTLTAHGLTTGYPLIYSRQNNTAISGFGRANYYFAIVIDADTIKLAETQEDALAGISKVIGAFSGTHRLYKCGIARNIKVLPSTINVGDVPVAGSATGVVIIAAASGGYHEQITVSNVDVVERNLTSGSHSFSVYGAQNSVISDCSAIGSKNAGVMVTSAFLNNVSDATGDISPTGGLELLPDVEIRDVTCLQFNGYGVRVHKGKALVEGCYVKSGVANVLGISISADSEGSKGARARYNTVNVPNGIPFDFVIGVGNHDENSTMKRDYSSKRIDSAAQTISKNLTTSGNVVGTCVSQDGTATNFSGVLFITVKQVDANASETAHYILQVAKGATTLAPQLVQVSAAGLLTGGGPTFPSFTWSIDNSNQLKATPIGSTNPDATWNFFTSTLGDLHVM